MIDKYSNIGIINVCRKQVLIKTVRGAVRSFMFLDGGHQVSTVLGSAIGKIRLVKSLGIKALPDYKKVILALSPEAKPLGPGLYQNTNHSITGLVNI